jgi:hypothetical protein
MYQSKLAYACCGYAAQLHYRTAAEHTPLDGHAANHSIRTTPDADGRNANDILIDCSLSVSNKREKNCVHSTENNYFFPILQL